jgi:uroporphyrinogen-III synthase
VAAVGRATAEQSRAYGFRVDFEPTVASGAQLARQLPARSGTVLLARSDRSLPDLPRILRERGFAVREVVAYLTFAQARGDVARVRALLGSNEPVAVLFHSPSAIAGMVDAIGAALIARADIRVAGGATLRAAREALVTDAEVSLIEEDVHVAYR